MEDCRITSTVELVKLKIALIIFLAEGGAAFAESSELAAALEAVLDERVLDERVLDERVLDERVLDERTLDSIADCVFTHSPHSHYAKNKVRN